MPTPVWVPTRFPTGNSLASLRQRQEAVQAFEEALHLVPEMTGAHINIAGVLLALGRYEAAEQHCQAALTLEPQAREAAECTKIARFSAVAAAISLRAKGTLISEPRFSTPWRDAISPTRARENGLFKGNPRQRPFSLYRVGKIASRRG